MKQQPTSPSRRGDSVPAAPGDSYRRANSHSVGADVWPSHDGALAEIVRTYVDRDGRSLNEIALCGLIDVAYLWRLRAGQRRQPSRDVLIRLGLALRLEPEEVDQLLVAADYAPITLRSV